MKKLKIHRKRGSNCTVVNMFEQCLLIFSSDRFVGMKVPYDGELKSYFIDTLDKRDKETIAHEMNTHRVVTEKELTDMYMHFMGNIFSK